MARFKSQRGVLSLSVLWISLWALTSACGGGGGGTDGDADADTDNDNDDSDVDGDNRLEAVGDTNIFLRYGETTELMVRYVDFQNAAISNATIQFEIVGEYGDSRLDAFSSTTREDGQASMRLVAGTSNMSFQVQAIPPMGNTVTFTVTISDEEVGSILVRMNYSGGNSFTSFRPLLWLEQSCESLDPEDLPTALRSEPPVSRLSDRTRFDALEPNESYTAGVVAEIDGRIEGFGCAHGISVIANQVTNVTIEITDIVRELNFAGTYEIESLLDFGGTLPTSVSVGIDVFDELTDDHDPDRDVQADRDTPDDMCGQDPGAFIVDYVMRQTCHWECLEGEEFDDCSEINHPIGDLCAVYENNFQSWDRAQQGLPDPLFGGCGLWEYAAVQAQELINTQIAEHLSFISAILNVIGDLSRAINEAHIFSILVVEESGDSSPPFSHTLTEMQVVLRDLDGASHVYRFDLEDVGLASLSASETADIRGETLTLSDHRFRLNYGRLILYIYTHGVLPLIGDDIDGDGEYTTAELLSSWIDCDVVGTRVHDWADEWLAPLTPGAGTFISACETGLDAAGEAVENYLGSAIDEEGILILAGMAEAGEVDEELFVQNLEDGVWEGQWGEGIDSGEVTGTFTGVRR